SGWPSPCDTAPARRQGSARHRSPEILSGASAPPLFRGFVQRMSPLGGTAELRGQCLGYGRMHQALEIAVVLRYLAHDARADVGSLYRWHHEDRLEALRHVPVHQRHLELVLEIANRPQAADVELGADLPGEIDQETLELSDFD